MSRLLVGLALCVVALAGGCSGGGAAVVVIDDGSIVLIAFDGAGDLYTLNQTTAAESLRLDTFYMPGMVALDLNRISAATWVPARSELWIGGGGLSACSACILRLDLGTGEATLLSDNTGTNRAIPDLALRPSDGAIFTTRAAGTGLHSIDELTGAATVINPNTASGKGNGLTFAGPGETLYLMEGLSPGRLCTVDPTTGSDALVSSMLYVGFPGTNPGIVAAATRPDDGVVFVLVKDGNTGRGTKDTYLGTIDVATAEVTIIARTVTRMEGLAFIPPGLLP